ncbi:MAG: thiamine pyrophosphate-dependent enzyme [Candidatus Altiarchaeota archaeon]
MSNKEDSLNFDLEGVDIGWCPGCGNFGILSVLKEALNELSIDPRYTVIVSGIGQAAKLPHYVNSHFFNGLHGRALPPATAIKAANPSLTVLAVGGDGDMYGEGGNHFIHTIRRNPDITNFVHDNMVYGLTKGQASPTSPLGFKTPLQVGGVISEPFNPIAVAVALDASFVARTFVGNAELTKEVFKKAIKHKGYALIDIFQPCPSFNKINTYQWFEENTYVLEDSYDPNDRLAAFGKAIEKEKLPLGVIYTNPHKPIFEENIAPYKNSDQPLFSRKVDVDLIKNLIDSKRGD